MLIDFHTHIFPDKIAERTIEVLARNTNEGIAYFDGTADGLVSHMEKANVDICISLPAITKPTQFESVARFGMEINEKYKNAKRRIISFGGIHPDCEDIDGKMKFLKECGFKGVKIHPDYQNTYIDDEKYTKIFESAKEYDLIVVTHSGVDSAYLGQPVRCTPQRICEALKKVSGFKFVLGHYGAREMWEETYELLAGKDVYFDTAFSLNEIDENLFKKILNKHGEDRVLFATDCPWRDIGVDAKILKSYNLGKETEDKIFYKNGIKLLGL